MEIKKVLVSGDALFLERYQLLFKAMSPHVDRLEYLAQGNLTQTRRSQKIKNLLPKFLLKPAEKFFRKNQQTFIKKSQETEQKIREFEFRPDLVFHLFALYCPFWDKFDIPYAMYLDYTMALAAKNWSAWAPFSNAKELDFWLDCERLAYARAYHILTMSNVVKTSLIEDYSIEPQKITVVGASANFPEPYKGEKSFGSKRILFNGSDFERKGGDLLLAAFKKVKQALPDAKLTIVGKKMSIDRDGIENPGHVSSRSDMRDLFLNTDLVVSPAYCDPFPVFLLEAMNYGVPCIVSAQDGMPEIVDNEVNGVVIPQPTPEVLAERIMALLSDNYMLVSMSEKARDKMKNCMNWNHIANKILQVLKNCEASQ
ncbi:glycosyltransferase family 4 protein [Planktothrix sp. FACHB-1355]|uniref:Glycosyltransferase family 4 protein n=1 Tax=Aerosakkonema funiforme FACHB-1375 TaxID=2949571 RepID=A0A926VJA2_9CYAN|nr:MULTISPECIES: glycosyltransferase family 4 protein [Oscillatoriales]MBD2183569.1 glycosyltransferase family 4 protein [Aerosakkonema funiforme FACHB-1375]MBD3559576.1 glycosyltransferase family 4 protein [Planktothrix sp. FACHB-1355]